MLEHILFAAGIYFPENQVVVAHLLAGVVVDECGCDCAGLLVGADADVELGDVPL